MSIKIFIELFPNTSFLSKKYENTHNNNKLKNKFMSIKIFIELSPNTSFLSKKYENTHKIKSQ